MNLDDFVCRENISRFTNQLQEVHAPEIRRTLIRLLVEEEDRFVSSSAAHDFIKRKMTELDGRIVRQESIVSDLRANGEDTNTASKIMNNLIEIRDVCAQYSERLLKNLISSGRYF